jgi:hypothetical protein
LGDDVSVGARVLGLELAHWAANVRVSRAVHILWKEGGARERKTVKKREGSLQQVPGRHPMPGLLCRGDRHLPLLHCPTRCPTSRRVWRRVSQLRMISLRHPGRALLRPTLCKLFATNIWYKKMPCWGKW